MTRFSGVLCAQQEEVYVTLQMLWGYVFFQESIFLVIIPADPTQEQMMPRSDK